MQKKLVVFACISLLRGSLCSAAIITVNWDGSADYATIQAAINAASNGDTVLVADGTYTGDGNRDIDFLGKAITVKSANGPENCIIDCQDYGRGFYFHSGEDPNSVLDGFTIKNGDRSSGGGIRCANSSPTITNCTISGCYSNNAGGGIFCVGGSPYIINCIISSNRASCLACLGEGGGGIYLYNCQALISESIITNNNAYGYFDDEDIICAPVFGGGLYIKSSNVTINNCIIHGNKIDWGGGGGGGIACDNSTVLINICTITSNRARGNEGGCGVVGGGLYNCIGTISNCTIIGNRASVYSGYGGGLASCGGTITNCIVWNNTADDDGDQIYSSSTPTYSCIQDWTGWGIGNIDVDPFFADQDNGDYHLNSSVGRWDPDAQIWVEDFWGLDPNGTPDDPNDDFWIPFTHSPCIDAGIPVTYEVYLDPNGTPNDPNDDFWTWIPIPSSDYSDEPWPNGHRVNMGAYGNTPEASRSCTNIDDVRLMGADWLQADSVTDIMPFPDGDGIVDLRDYAFLALHWLWPEQ